MTTRRQRAACRISRRRRVGISRLTGPVRCLKVHLPRGGRPRNRIPKGHRVDPRSFDLYPFARRAEDPARLPRHPRGPRGGAAGGRASAAPGNGNGKPGRCGEPGHPASSTASVARASGRFASTAPAPARAAWRRTRFSAALADTTTQAPTTTTAGQKRADHDDGAEHHHDDTPRRRRPPPPRWRRPRRPRPPRRRRRSAGTASCEAGETCGTCPIDCPCSGGKSCVEGRCECPPGQGGATARASASAVNSNVPGYCGSCDNACTGGQGCVDGQCACDYYHCGPACPCPGAQVCIEGFCYCDGQQCGTNCGCFEPLECRDGRCQCPVGQGDCDNSGICLSLADDPDHCGSLHQRLRRWADSSQRRVPVRSQRRLRHGLPLSWGHGLPFRDVRVRLRAL